MARNYPADTRAQRALEELYEKETVAQLNWFLKCEKLKKDGPSTTLSPAAIHDMPVPKLRELYPNRFEKPGHEVAPPTKMEIKSEDQSICETVLLPEMKPPDPDVLSLLYDGVSKERKGRYLYLKERNKIPLETKFTYPILSSMDYGWGHAELISQGNAQSKKHGRSGVVKDTFYRRTGIPFIHGLEMLGLDKRAF